MIRPPLQDGLDDCPDENTIVAFLDGVLPDADLVTLEAHCAHCERCREGLALAARALSASVTPPSERAAAALQREIESAMHGVLRESARALALVGERIGRFEIVGVQGSGQFGVVYRARDMELARLVAVKVMRRSGRRDQPLTEALFRREAAATARLQHPNIVTLHDYGTFEGAPYLILELLEGETLRDRLDRAPPMAPRDALSIIGDVTSALVEAHAAGVIHRDIKPSNVFLCASGQVKVLDLAWRCCTISSRSRSQTRPRRRRSRGPAPPDTWRRSCSAATRPMHAAMSTPWGSPCSISSPGCRVPLITSPSSSVSLERTLRSGFAGCCGARPRPVARTGLWTPPRCSRR